MRWIALIAVCLVGILAPKPAAAWGKFGHLTTCDLAYRNLTPTSREALKHLLRSESGGITVKGRGRMPDRHYTSFNVGCLEEDEVPRQHEADHFINVPRSATMITGCPGTGECVLSGIARDFAILRDTSKTDEERVFALMALGHWLGDIHQPLHISYADDRGGNGIDATLAGKCGTSTYRVENLHGVWDNCLLEAGLFERVRQRRDFSRNWSRFTITYRAVDTLMANTSLTQEKAIVAGDPQAWANESYAITRDSGVRYCVQVGSQCQYSASSATKTNPKRVEALNQTYLAAYKSIAEERVRNAGFRLAHLINQALDPAYAGPNRDGQQP